MSKQIVVNSNSGILFSHEKNEVYMLQNGEPLKTSCHVRETILNKPQIIRFSLYEMSKIGNSIGKESKLIVLKG